MIYLFICLFATGFDSEIRYVGTTELRNISSSINGVIRPVLNFLIFFYDNISQVQKSTKKH